VAIVRKIYGKNVKNYSKCCCVVVVPIKDNTYFSKFSLWLARSPCISNICIYLHSGDPHEVWYSLNNGGHNISFGKCTTGLTVLDPKFK